MFKIEIDLFPSNSSSCSFTPLESITTIQLLQPKIRWHPHSLLYPFSQGQIHCKSTDADSDIFPASTYFLTPYCSSTGLVTVIFGQVTEQPPNVPPASNLQRILHTVAGVVFLKCMPAYQLLLKSLQWLTTVIGKKTHVLVLSSGGRNSYINGYLNKLYKQRPFR